MTPLSNSRGRPWRLLILGSTLALLGGRLMLIDGFGTSLPYRDQWKCTAIDLLAPWVAGRLGWRDFFTPLNDHWPVLTRLLSFALTWLNGQWNNLLETSVNALLVAAAAGLFLKAILPALGRVTGPLFALLAAIVLGLPATWENTLWGIQSLVFFQILLSLVYLRAVAEGRGFTTGWWLGQVAGGLVLFTQQSGVLAFAAAVVLLAWRWRRRDGDRRLSLAGLILAAAGIAAYVAAAPDFSVTAALRADSWRVALDVALRQLGWPLPHPAWAFLIWLPWVVFAAGRLARSRLTACNAFLVVTGLWVGAQAAAIGYGRGGEITGFVSRYCDFLALGILVNAACLALLVRMASGARRRAVVAAALVWLACLVPGFWHETFASHAGYTFLHRGEVNARNLELVRSFLTSNDPAALAPERGGYWLYSYPPAVVELLRDSRFRALLPPETGAAEARRDYGRIGAVARVLPPAGPWLSLAGLGLLLIGAIRLWRNGGVPAGGPPPETLRWNPRRVWLGWTVVTVGCGALWAGWSQPLVFDTARRWATAFAPERDGIEFAELIFHQTAYGPRIEPGQARGAVDTEPAEAGSNWYGTKIGGYDFTGILQSEPMVIRQRFLFTPYTGWPSWPGNGLRWRLEHPGTKEEAWLSLVAPNPEQGFSIWTADVSRYQGWQASLCLYDGQTDAVHGWLGVARPAVGDDPAFGGWWLAQIRAERAEATHVTLVAASAATFIVWLGLAVAVNRAVLAAFWRRRLAPAG